MSQKIIGGVHLINIVHVNIHCDDGRKITAVEMKLKSIAQENDPALTDQALASTATAAFFKTTLLADVGVSMKTVPNPKRKNVVNIIVTLNKSDRNNLTNHDIANFLEAFQTALDTTTLNFH